ncbi:MAG: GAF domain-containing sensor histidine kinase [Anaerolinea sp.]|nr:GAF domain-containing sensor histidine kinase [Anaerolinea sp.]
MSQQTVADVDAGTQTGEERARELATLLHIAQDITSNLSPDFLLREILEKLKTVVNFSNATIVRREGDLFHSVADWLELSDQPASRVKFPASNYLDQKVMASGRPLLIGDAHYDDTEEARDFRRQASHFLQTYYKSVRTWMRVPLIFKGETIGMLTLHNEQPNAYTAHHADLAMAFASYAAIALENAQIFAASQRRADQFRAINEAGQHITALLSEDELLEQTQKVIRDNFGYYFISIGLVDGENLLIRTDCDCGRTQLKVGEEGAMGWVAAHGRPLLIPDAAQDPRFIPAASGARTLSELALPIQLKDRLIGVLNIESDQRDAFGADDIVILQALANQLAVALENIRLYEQARQLAALEERQKLARDLHDSVSQALYGIALGTRTARALLEREPAQAAEPLDYIASLAEAGLAEMRALIFELRPESLQSEGLTAALIKQVEAARARHQLDVVVDFCSEPEASLEIKEVFYRVAQEALHNIAKHARANRVELRLENGDGRLTLSIRDDGQGFDPAGEFPGHLGLHSMRERVEAVGGMFRLESAPGRGTLIQVEI